VNAYRLFIASSLLVSSAWSFGACSGSSETDDGTGGKKGKGGSAGGGNQSGSANGGTVIGVGGTAGVSGAAGAGEPGGAGGDDGGETCAASTQVAELTTANLLFVIDKSGSMECNPPNGDADLAARCATFPQKEDPNERSKWEVTHAALVNALDTLSMQSNVRAGLMLFPVPERAPASVSRSEESCYVDGLAEVEIGGLGARNRAALDEVLDGVTPGGETPLVGATILGYKYLSEALLAGSVTGNNFVVLLTDGAETCARNLLTELVERDVPTARQWNIRTFVIGAPGSEQARSLLSEIAYQGGTAASAGCSHGSSRADRGDCHFDMTESADLATDLNAALQEISRTKILSCEYDVPENPDGTGVDLNKVNVTFTPGEGRRERISKDDSDDCSAVDGWQYNADYTKIELCGEICDRVQADPEGKVSIELGCPTVVK
jgi:Mg-chelatase subunit ChlD